MSKTRKAPPLTAYVPLEVAARWLSDDQREFTTNELILLAIDRKLVLSLEFVTGWTAYNVEIVYCTDDEISEVINSVRSGNKQQTHSDSNTDFRECDSRARIIRDGPTQPDSDPPARSLFALYNEELRSVDEVADIFIDETSKAALRKTTRRCAPATPKSQKATSPFIGGIVLYTHSWTAELIEIGVQNSDPFPPLTAIPDEARMVIRTENLISFVSGLEAPELNQQQSSHPAPAMSRGVLRKAKTREMHLKWYEQYKNLKKKHPKRKDEWLADQIAKSSDGNGRSAGTIRRVISDMKNS